MTGPDRVYLEAQRRTTYIAEAAPRSRRSAGLIKVGSSHAPQRRARELGMRLIVATTLQENLVHRLFAPFAVPLDEVRARRLEPNRRTEWYFDCAEIREFADWVSRVHSARHAVLHDEVALYLRENPGVTANEVARALRGRRSEILAAVKEISDSGAAEDATRFPERGNQPLEVTASIQEGDEAA